MSHAEVHRFPQAPSGYEALLALDQTVLDALPSAVYVCSADGTLVRHNRRAAELWGRSPRPGDTDERFCGAFRLYNLDGTGLPHADTPMATALADGQPQRGREVVIERPDGSRLIALVNIEPLLDQYGRVQGAINCFDDITERKRTENLLQVERNHTRSILDALPAAIYTTDAEGRITYFNPAAADLAGRKPTIGHDKWCVTFRLYRPDGTPLPHDECPMAIAIKERRAIRGQEAIAERPDGTRVPFVPYPTPMFGASGDLIGAINMLVDIGERKKSEVVLRAQTERLEALNRIAKTLSGDLTLENIVQAVTDSATELSGAEFGAFFYNQVGEQGERYQLYTLSGAPRSAFDKFGMPRNTALFSTTFRGEGIVRSDNIQKDPRYGREAPHFGMPPGHLPVTSYLAVPVISRNGTVHGGLFFGHHEPGRFTKESEEIVAGIAAHAAIAIDNSRLLQSAKTEIEQRRRAEESLARRMDEQAVLYRFTDRLHRATARNDVFEAALDAIVSGLRCERASVLLFDSDGVMRFVAWRGLSDAYRQAVEGHSPWTVETIDPQPLCLDDIGTADLGEELRATVEKEGIGALAFIPLMAGGRLAGKFMAYYDGPHAFTAGDIGLGVTIARQLGFTLERMRAEDARRRAEEDLRKNEERERARAAELQAIMEAVPAIIWIAQDADCRSISGNRMSYEFLRLRPEQNPSLSAPEDVRPRHFEVLMDGRVLSPDELPVQRAARGEEIQNFEGQVRFDDGTSRFLLGNATPLHDAGGRPYGAVAAFVDITDRKKAEEERDLLVAELSHRVKNTLATVISIARQSVAKSLDPKDAYRSFEARIRALAQTHSRLADAHWSGVSLGTMLQDECSPYRREDGTNIRLSGPPVTLSPKCALTLGMAVHELATNAAKYGALTTKSGSVDVSWRVDRPVGRLRIRWSESGGPLVGPPARSGFGRMLLERALASDLRGEVRLDYAAEGVTCDIAIPLDGHVMS